MKPVPQPALNPEVVEKKLRLSLWLFEAAFEIKRYQIQKKNPHLSDAELDRLTLSKFESH